MKTGTAKRPKSMNEQHSSWFNVQTITNWALTVLLGAILGSCRAIFNLFDRVKQLEGRVDASATKTDLAAVKAQLDGQAAVLQEVKETSRQTHDAALEAAATSRAILELQKRS